MKKTIYILFIVLTLIIVLLVGVAAYYFGRAQQPTPITEINNNQNVNQPENTNETTNTSTISNQPAVEESITNDTETIESITLVTDPGVSWLAEPAQVGNLS